MIHDYTLRLLPQECGNQDLLKKTICQIKGLNPQHVTSIQLLKRSIDARQRTIFIQLQVRVFENEQPQASPLRPIHYQDVSHSNSIIIVGAGPAGIFAALKTIELGYKPILIERGKDVSERKKDIATSIRHHHIDPESNYCFGEGGAGAFSDGKLYTRSKKRGNVQRILQIFHQFGASDSILIDAHPHIGTDRLPRIIANMRQQILNSGGEVHFETRMTKLKIKNNRVFGIKCQNGAEFDGPVILATGHSARDVYNLLENNGLPLEAKGFAMGVRVEHPQILIDKLMYHNIEGRGHFLPAAEYSFVQQVNERGVYSFCMCPGGFIVPATDCDGRMVVNGMSPSNRGSKWANSGIVVEIRPEDIFRFKDWIKKETDIDYREKDPLYLQLLALQQAYEHNTYKQTQSTLTAPAQRMADFVTGKNSTSLPDSSYIPGIQSSPIHEWMPKELRSRLQKGFQAFDQSIKGFLTNEAQIIAAETRTSSPVRVLRDNSRLNMKGIEGLYPCGEGAGYAGGIVSSAIDGELCAEQSILYERNK